MVGTSFRARVVDGGRIVDALLMWLLEEAVSD